MLDSLLTTLQLEVLPEDDINSFLLRAKGQYKKLALSLHPDCGGAEDKFKEMANAYELLLSEKGLTQVGKALGEAEKSISLFILFRNFKKEMIAQEGRLLNKEKILALASNMVEVNQLALWLKMSIAVGYLREVGDNVSSSRVDFFPASITFARFIMAHACATGMHMDRRRFKTICDYYMDFKDL